MRHPVQEVIGAVERVDDDGEVATARRRNARFLAKKSHVWMRTLNGIDNGVFSCLIVMGDEVRASLAFEVDTPRFVIPLSEDFSSQPGCLLQRMHQVWLRCMAHRGTPGTGFWATY